MRPRSSAYRVFKLLQSVRVARLKDIVRATGMSPASVYSALQTLQKSGHVEKVSGVYVLKKNVW